MRARVRVLIVGGHALSRAGLRALVEREPGLECVGDVASGADVPDGGPRPDVILLDVDDAADSRVDLLRRAQRIDAQARLLVVAGRDVQDLAGPLVVAGARGIVTKDKPASHLVDAITKVCEGELWIDRATTARLIADFTAGRAPEASDPERASIESLTQRERDVIALLATGLSNKSIARELGISDNTVRHHLTSIFGKVGVPDRLSLVLTAVRHKPAFRRPA